MLISLMRRMASETSIVSKMSSINLFRSFSSCSFSSRLYPSLRGRDCTFFSKSISLCICVRFQRIETLPLLLNRATKLSLDAVDMTVPFLIERLLDLPSYTIESIHKYETLLFHTTCSIWNRKYSNRFIDPITEGNESRIIPQFANP